MDATSPNEIRDVLVVGASRGLGEAIVEEYVARGAHVVATVRGDAPNPLRAFAATRPGDVEVEQVDVTAPGGPGASLEVGEAIPPLLDVVAAQRGRAGQQFLDRHGEPLPW